MPDWLAWLLLVIGFFVLVKWVLPRFGVQT